MVMKIAFILNSIALVFLISMHWHLQTEKTLWSDMHNDFCEIASLIREGKYTEDDIVNDFGGPIERIRVANQDEVISNLGFPYEESRKIQEALFSDETTSALRGNDVVTFAIELADHSIVNLYFCFEPSGKKVIDFGARLQ